MGSLKITKGSTNATPNLWSFIRWEAGKFLIKLEIDTSHAIAYIADRYWPSALPWICFDGKARAVLRYSGREPLEVAATLRNIVEF